MKRRGNISVSSPTRTTQIDGSNKAIY